MDILNDKRITLAREAIEFAIKSGDVELEASGRPSYFGRDVMHKVAVEALQRRLPKMSAVLRKQLAFLAVKVVYYGGY